MRSLVADLLVAAGLLFISAGAWLAYRPAGLIVAGIVGLKLATPT